MRVLIEGQAQTSTLWFGRDPFGRRSLLLHRGTTGNEGEISLLLASSLCKEVEMIIPPEQWAEVPCHALHSISLPLSSLEGNYPEIDPTKNAEDINEDLCGFLLRDIDSHPWALPEAKLTTSSVVTIEPTKEGSKPFELKIPAMFLPYGTRTPALISESETHNEEEFQHAVDEFINHLGEAVRRRLQDLPPPHESRQTSSQDTNARVAIMFSGGIDSTLIAALATRYLPRDQSIEYVGCDVVQSGALTDGGYQSVECSIWQVAILCT